MIFAIAGTILGAGFGLGSYVLWAFIALDVFKLGDPTPGRFGEVRLLVFLSLPVIMGVFIVAGALAGFMFGRRFPKHWVGSLVCRECGYNLAGNVSGICPECGRSIHTDVHNHPATSVRNE